MDYDKKRFSIVLLAVYIPLLEMGSFTEEKKKATFFRFHFPTETVLKFMKPKLFSLVQLLLSDHILGNTVEKDFQFINIYTLVRGKDWKKYDKNLRLVLGNKCEIYLFTKEMKKINKKKGNIIYD